MTTTHKIIMACHWSIFTGWIIGLFWLIWWLVTGSVPVCHEMWITPTWVFNLPPEPRWIDWLLGPIYSAIFVWLFTCETARKRRMLPALLVVSIVTLFFGLAASLAANELALALPSPLIFGLVVGLAAATGDGLDASLLTALGAGLAAGLGAGLSAGLLVGLSVGLSAGLLAMLVAALTFGLARLFSPKPWKAFCHWLMDKDQEVITSG